MMSTALHPITWFESKVGKSITRNGKTFKVPSKEAAPYCHQLQEEGYKFSDPLEKPKLRISTAPDSVCISCEG